uniref:Si:ch1073-70f20.1 n=1 Tax=Myripristis murdjan TaxID=586833 RepID=A0A667Z1Q9_9TELE
MPMCLQQRGVLLQHQRLATVCVYVCTCEYMGQVYGIGESWITKDCYQCVCMEPFGVGCCDYGSQPVDYPDWCEIIRKPDSCSSVAVMRANHKLPCLWGRGRLRPAAAEAQGGST